MSADFSRVPVITVTSDNIVDVWPTLQLAIQRAHFVAVDCELSGLGDRKKLNDPSIDNRYENVCTVAQTRSIIALGLSCFTLIPSESEKSWHYRVQTYNVIILCAEDYIVEPAALKFLVEHGFDFEQQYSRGLPYYRGNDRPQDSPCHLRELFSLLIKHRHPLVVHNGLIDLLFLYQNLYAQLPQKLSSFTADLTEMFPAGIYDTKYLADYVSRSNASYLEYLFRKEQKNNVAKFESARPHVLVSFDEFPSDFSHVEYRECGVNSRRDVSENGHPTEVCDSYMHHGHCPQGNSCPKSHDIDLIISKKEGKKRKRPAIDHEEDSTKSLKVENGGKVPSQNGKESSKQTFSGHRAGFDAFMTGFTFVTHLVHYSKMPLKPKSFQPTDLNTVSIVNRIYLVSKDFPFLVQKSAFAKISEGHFQKYQRIFVEKP